MPIDENIKSAFDNPNLENEGWLEPSDSVFSGVMDAIDDKPRRRVGLLYWLFGLLLIAAISLMIPRLFSNGEKNVGGKSYATDAIFDWSASSYDESQVTGESKEGSSSELRVTGESKEGSSSKIRVTGELKGGSGNELRVARVNGNQGQRVNADDSPEARYQHPDKTSFRQENNESILATRNQNLGTEKIDNEGDLATRNPNLGTEKMDDESVLATRNQNLGTEKTDNESVLATRNPNLGTEKMDNESVLATRNPNLGTEKMDNESVLATRDPNLGTVKASYPTLSSLDLLSPVVLNNLSYNRTLDFNSVYVPIEPVKNIKWFVGFGMGYSIWDFNLNNDYIEALNPADFNHESGKGEFINLSIGQYSNKGHRLSLNFGYETILMKSGHNSVLVYDIEDEVDHMNAYDIVMATPLGFITSNIVVERDPNSVLTDATDIVVDLNNSHRVKSFNFDLEYSHRMFTTGSIRFYTDITGGLNYIQSVTNRLDQFGVAQNAFMSGQSSVTSSQTNINSVRTHLGLGLSLEKSLGRQTALRASYLYRRDLNVVHSVDNFSTQLGMHRIGLQLIRSL